MDALLAEDTFLDALLADDTFLDVQLTDDTFLDALLTDNTFLDALLADDRPLRRHLHSVYPLASRLLSLPFTQVYGPSQYFSSDSPLVQFVGIWKASLGSMSLYAQGLRQVEIRGQQTVRPVWAFEKTGEEWGLLPGRARGADMCESHVRASMKRCDPHIVT